MPHRRWLLLSGLWLFMFAGCGPKATSIGPGHIYEPDEREQRLWQATQDVSAELQASGKLHDDPKLERYVNSVLERILGEHGLAYVPLKPRVFILDSPSVNAFSLSHGHLYFHTGILGRMRNEAQLAMLLGHEITHSTHRHLHLQREDIYVRTGAHGYITVLSALGGSNVQKAVSAISELITIAAISGYSKEKEEEADRVGLTLMAQAGYDPREGAKMFASMLEASSRGDRGMKLFYATHPKMKKRVESCEKLIKRMPPELLASAKETGRDRYVDHAIELIYDEVERHTVQGRYALAHETLDFLAEVRPEDARTHACLGELCRARWSPRDRQQAREAYERALRIEPENPTALRGLGLLCVKAGQKDDASRYLRAYLDSVGDVPDVDYIRQTIERLDRD